MDVNDGIFLKQQMHAQAIKNTDTPALDMPANFNNKRHELGYIYIYIFLIKNDF